MILTTTSTVAGCDIAEYFDVVFGSGRSVREAVSAMKEEAAFWDADAVVGVRVAASESGEGTLGGGGSVPTVHVIGTAVKLDDASNET